MKIADFFIVGVSYSKINLRDGMPSLFFMPKLVSSCYSEMLLLELIFYFTKCFN